MSWDWRDEDPIQADRELLEICVSNLLVNGLKYGAQWLRLFSRADGAGLGLYLVARIVEHHSGRVWCEPDPGSGTSFFIWLPRATGDST